LPLADKRSEFVGGQVHAIERGQACAALDILNLELHLAVGKFFVGVQISEARFDDTALKSFRSDLGSGGSVDDGFTHVGLFEERRGLQVVPVLLGERIGHLLLEALLLTELLIFTDGHGYERG
jgi:hypothetical protein